MTFYFANPLGLLALLGVPALVVIHLFQQRPRRLAVSTLFLLERLGPESLGGRRLERFRASVPFWLQTLAVLLFTWLLAEPRWVRPDATLRLVAVLDSSLSMDAFRQPLLEALQPELARAATASRRTEFLLLESDPGRPALYSGGDLEELLAAAAAWQPSLGAHDLQPSARLAQSIAGPDGLAVLFTDHPLDPPPADVAVVSVGSPTPNVGFAGHRIEPAADGMPPVWRATVRNYSDTRQERPWFLRSNGQTAAQKPVVLDPGQAAVLSGAFPEGSGRIEIILDPDAFPADDALPLIVPRTKELRVAYDSRSPLSSFFNRLAAQLPGVAASPPAQADLRLATLNPRAGERVTGPAIIFVNDPVSATGYLEGPIVAPRSPLMADLNWQPLLVQNTVRLATRSEDDVLLWQGGHPLLFLRTDDGAPQLVVNMDLLQSNAQRLPAFVLLMHRFLDSLRSAKPAPESLNVDTSQQIQAVPFPDGPAPIVFLPGSPPQPLQPPYAFRAPARPGFFEVRQGDTPLLEAAAQFGDAREADLAHAAAAGSLEASTARLARRFSEADPLAPLVLVLLLGIMLLNWAWLAGFFSALGASRRAMENGKWKMENNPPPSA